MRRLAASFLALLLLLAVPALVRGQGAPEDHCPTLSAVDPPAGPAAANTMTVIGDSWGFLYFNALSANLSARGFGDQYDLYLRAIPGATAEGWAGAHCVLEAVGSILRSDPGTPVVLISLGGNDLVNDYDEEGDGIYARLKNDFGAIVAALLAERSDAVIIFGGYDIINASKSQQCRDWAISLVGSDAPEALNPLLLQIGDTQAWVASFYPNVHFADVAGALQGSPGAPDIYAWSPLRYFILYPFWQADCIHMSGRGYRVFTNAILDWALTNGAIPPPALP